jgi:hypothetical protein
MARNDEEEIRKLEAEAVQLGYSAAEGSIKIGELELANQFRWIAGRLTPERMTSAETPAERKRVRQEISKRTKELSDVVREKHIKHHLPFSCIDDHDECVRKRKRQRKSTYCTRINTVGFFRLAAQGLSVMHCPAVGSATKSYMRPRRNFCGCVGNIRKACCGHPQD